MAAGQNFSQGLLQGFGLTESILDGAEERKRRRMLAGREDEEHAYRKERRGVLDARQDQQADNQQIQFQQGQEDRTRDIKRQGVEDSRRTSEFEQQQKVNAEYNSQSPMRKRIAESQLRSTELGLDSKEMELRRTKQNDINTQTAADLQGAYNLASLATEATDPAEKEKYTKQATTQYEKAIKDSGMKLEFLKNGGAQRIKSTTQKLADSLKNGQAPNLQDPETLDVVNNLMTASLKSSGRDEQYEPAGMTYQSGMFQPMLKDKKTGKISPATDMFSSNKGDTISGITIDEFIDVAGAASSVAELGALVGNLKSAQAVMGGSEKASGMTDDMQLATLKHGHAKEMDKIKNDRTEKDQGWDLKRTKFGDGEDDIETDQMLAFIKDDGYSADEADQLVPEMRQLMNDHEHINTPQEAWKEIQSKQENSQLIQQGSASIQEKHPELSDQDSQKITQQIIDQEIYGEAEQEAFVKKFIENKSKKDQSDKNADDRRAKRLEKQQSKINALRGN